MSFSRFASFTRRRKYDVFLNFRGGDIRIKFLSHLREALQRAKLVAFCDEDLPRGKEVSPALFKAIEKSRVAVTIFSGDYASSPWCLDELAKIIECYENEGQIVIPVFYNVSSSVVLEQSGIYAEAFDKHERDEEHATKVAKWKAAMTKAANISGRSARNTRPESKLVNEIVNDILTSLGRTLDDGKDGSTVERRSEVQESRFIKVPRALSGDVMDIVLDGLLSFLEYSAPIVRAIITYYILRPFGYNLHMIGVAIVLTEVQLLIYRVRKLAV